MVKKSVKRRLYAALAMDTIILLSAAFIAASILYGRSWSDTAVPPLLGNKPEVISILTDGQMAPQPFTFLVVGDTRSSAIFEQFYKDGLRDAAPDFGVVLGDFVAFPAVSRHRFFIGELAEWGMRFPLFLIAGNHDFARTDSTDSNIKHEKNLGRLYDPFFQQDFEKLYGPMNYSFIYRGCLFIGLNDVYTTGHLDYLKDVLANRPSNILMTFVFMHIAPKSLSPLLQTRQMEGEEEFMQLMDSYDVDYVFAGDFHSYFRADRGHTKYIVTGGGGSDLRGGGRGFHHVLIMRVDPSKDRVDEMIYSIKPIIDVGDEIEIAMICGIYPVFEKHPVVWVLVFSLVMLAVAARVTFLLAWIARKRRVLRRRRT
jgi:hypothetical protein